MPGMFVISIPIEFELSLSSSSFEIYLTFSPVTKKCLGIKIVLLVKSTMLGLLPLNNLSKMGTCLCVKSKSTTKSPSPDLFNPDSISKLSKFNIFKSENSVKDDICT